MTRRIVSFICAAAFLTALVPVGVMAAKNPEKGQIEAAVKSGKLTRQDAKRLKAEKKALHAEVKAAKAKGKLTPEERAQFKAQRDKLNSEINALTK